MIFLFSFISHVIGMTTRFGKLLRPKSNFFGLTDLSLGDLVPSENVAEIIRVGVVNSPRTLKKGCSVLAVQNRSIAK